MLLHAVFAFEALDSSSRVDKPLCACVKRMAVRTNLDVNLRQRRMGFEGIAAGTGHLAAAVFGMDSSFHCGPS